jgi:4-hydroxybutyrate CoA-transferase
MPVARLDLSVDPKREYERKLMTPEQAAGLVESGDLVWIPSTHVPPAILAVLATRERELRDVTIRSVIIPNMGWFREDAAAAWNLQVQYALAPDNRRALADRLIDFHPFHMINEHKVRDARRGEERQIDDLMLVVSPPNPQGWVCVGNSVWDAVTSARRARRVIVEQSAAQPLTTGDSWLHVSQLDAIVPGERSRLAMNDPDPANFPASDHAIAANLKTLVKDRATIQLGLGKRTTAAMLLGAFDHANDLGYFGELTVPGTIERARRGIITSKYAEVHPGRFVSCNMGNSFEDLDTIEGNPFFELHSYEHTNDPKVISRHDDMLTINCALGIDLTGQIAVYALGPSVYTGLGGQLAFHLGAFLSKRGRAVTLIPSIAKGKVSTIVPQFSAGQIVSIPRELADTIVTEQGVAHLLGKSVRERAEALCQVAHPDHRDWLRSEARRLYYP